MPRPKNEKFDVDPNPKTPLQNMLDERDKPAHDEKPKPAPVATDKPAMKPTAATGDEVKSDKPTLSDAKPKSTEKKRTFPLKPYEALSEKTEKITLALSEDIVQVYEDAGDDIAKVGADLIEAHAKRMGWL